MHGLPTETILLPKEGLHLYYHIKDCKAVIRLHVWICWTYKYSYSTTEMLIKNLLLYYYYTVSIMKLQLGFGKLFPKITYYSSFYSQILSPLSFKGNPKLFSTQSTLCVVLSCMPQYKNDVKFLIWTHLVKRALGHSVRVDLNTCVSYTWWYSNEVSPYYNCPLSINFVSPFAVMIPLQIVI